MPNQRINASNIGTAAPSQTAVNESYVLRLRVPNLHESSTETVENPRVRWTQDVVDNEHMNKRSSKKCCIFHRKKNYDSSDTESDGSDTDSDDEFMEFHSLKPSNSNKSQKKHSHGHSHCKH
eukprot:snap_masked-scaffold_11-processed-gene-5.30-mRNA-1 protein AED:0.10 eAED:0.10 QI:0/-1/0/1/-1/1/1/0/121